MNKRNEIFSLIIWTVAASALGILVSLIFLPFFGVGVGEALHTMTAGVFSDKFTMGDRKSVV